MLVDSTKNILELENGVNLTWLLGFTLEEVYISVRMQDLNTDHHKQVFIRHEYKQSIDGKISCCSKEDGSNQAS